MKGSEPMSWWKKLKGMFKVTSSALHQASSVEALEEQLLMADFGVTSSQCLSQYAQKPEELKQAVLDILNKAAMPITLRTDRKPMVVLMIGVNGAGKTTTIAKMAYMWRHYRVGLVAADTFRHGAVEQLGVWAQRLKIPFYSGGKDAASVVFDALSQAKKDGLDLLLVDTSGRLHTQANLMSELAKIKRVIQKIDSSAPHETILVLDGTTGQNALTQAEQFDQHVGVTGFIMTKLDGTAKGGMLVNITEKMAKPIYYIATGETLEDLESFHAQNFADALLGVPDSTIEGE